MMSHDDDGLMSACFCGILGRTVLRENGRVWAYPKMVLNLQINVKWGRKVRVATG